MTSSLIAPTLTASQQRWRREPERPRSRGAAIKLHALLYGPAKRRRALNGLELETLPDHRTSHSPAGDQESSR